MLMSVYTWLLVGGYLAMPVTYGLGVLTSRSHWRQIGFQEGREAVARQVRAAWRERGERYGARHAITAPRQSPDRTSLVQSRDWYTKV